jgi:hypothetical protein
MNTLNTYSGADIVATIGIPGLATKTIGELQTISYSTHRVVNPVRSLGRINAAGFVRGPRTIGGSLIFTVFNQALIQRFQGELFREYNKLQSITGIKQNEDKKSVNNTNQMYQSFTATRRRVRRPDRMLIDEMPPFNVTISFANEFGSRSVLQILGIIVFKEGQVMSIEDIMTESTMQFIAQEVIPMEARA